MVLGTSTAVEAEAHDRVTITLPGVQSQLAAKVRRLATVGVACEVCARAWCRRADADVCWAWPRCWRPVSQPPWC